jgi:RNA polymerase sigma-70 factor (ECF subfamily)
VESYEFGTIANSFRTLLSAGTAGPCPDSQLRERFVRQSDDAAEAAFTALVERHGPMALRVCCSVLHDTHAAEDAFQATFLTLARKAHTIRNRESLASWLFGVARRVSGRAKVQRSRRAAMERNGVAMIASHLSGSVGEDQLLPEVHDEVDWSPEKYRQPIVLCYLEGLTHEEAAGQLRLPSSRPVKPGRQRPSGGGRGPGRGRRLRQEV